MSNNCANSNEIDNFIGRIQIETWSNYEKINVTQHDTRPTFRFEKWITQDLLDAKILQ